MIENKSRRTFLKRAPVLAGAVVATGIVGKGLIEGNHVEQIRVSAPFADLYPMYEVHPQPPVTRDFVNLPINLHYVELDFDQSSALRLSAYGNLTQETVHRPHAVTYDLLQYFAKRNILVCLKGQTIGDDLFSLSLLTELGETGIATLTSTAESIDSIISILNGEGKMSRSVFLRKSAVALASIWASTPVVVNRLSPNGVNSGRILEEGVKTSSMTHPENLTLFLRNLFMTRQLQLCADKLKTWYKIPKPSMSYEVGKDHAGIEVMADHPEFLVSAIGCYPNVVLNRVMDENGGIQQFCQTAIYDPREILANGPLYNQVSWVFDFALENMLRQKLSRSD